LTKEWFWLTKTVYLIESFAIAEVAELADALRSGRSGQYAHEGSNPSFGTKPCESRVFLSKSMVELTNFLR
jgi:hypothetical protein